MKDRFCQPLKYSDTPQRHTHPQTSQTACVGCWTDLMDVRFGLPCSQSILGHPRCSGTIGQESQVEAWSSGSLMIKRLYLLQRKITKATHMYKKHTYWSIFHTITIRVECRIVQDELPLFFYFCCSPKAASPITRYVPSAIMTVGYQFVVGGLPLPMAN